MLNVYFTVHDHLEPPTVLLNVVPLRVGNCILVGQDLRYISQSEFTYPNTLMYKTVPNGI